MELGEGGGGWGGGGEGVGGRMECQMMFVLGSVFSNSNAEAESSGYEQRVFFRRE